MLQAIRIVFLSSIFLALVGSEPLTDQERLISSTLGRIADLESAAQGRAYNDMLSDGMGCYVHLAQLTGQKRLWGRATEYIYQTQNSGEYNSAVLSSDFDSTQDGKDLSIASMEPCVSKTAIGGYYFASVVGVSSADHPGSTHHMSPAIANAKLDEFYGRFDENSELKQRIGHAKHHFMILAFPRGFVRGGSAECWFVDERNKPMKIHVPVMVECVDLIKAILERDDMKHWREAYLGRRETK